MITMETATLLEFTCPRCGLAAQEEFYGPCRTCIGELSVSMRLDGAGQAAADYVPKMNVTPNAVASKE
jgi:hypothetical protein